MAGWNTRHSADLGDAGVVRLEECGERLVESIAGRAQGRRACIDFQEFSGRHFSSAQPNHEMPAKREISAMAVVGFCLLPLCEKLQISRPTGRSRGCCAETIVMNALVSIWFPGIQAMGCLESEILSKHRCENDAMWLPWGTPMAIISLHCLATV